jgi:hypothetical protein
VGIGGVCDQTTNLEVEVSYARLTTSGPSKADEADRSSASLASSACHYSNGWGASTANDLSCRAASSLLESGEAGDCSGRRFEPHTRLADSQRLGSGLYHYSLQYYIRPPSSSSLQPTDEHSIALLDNADLHARLSRLGLTRPLHTAEDWWLV